MAKGKKSPAAKKPEAVLAPEVAQKVTALKNEGNKMFAERDYTKAVEQYEEAMKLLPDGSAERADLLCNKAACFYAVNKLKEAVKECGTALELAPNSIKALRHRAKALEKQGLYKQALTDIQTINKSESASDDSREAERRLKDLVAGRRPSLANGGARAAGPTGSQAARNPRSLSQWPFSAKCSLGNETRLVQLTATAGYADLLNQVKAKFPNAGDVLLKYVDKDGDLVTITNRSDVQAALTEALKQMDRRLGIIPPIRVQVVPADSKSDVPPIPLEEMQEAQRILQQQYQQLAAAQQAAQQQQALQQPKQQAQTSSGEIIEIDDWLVDFVHLFRDTTGIDADRHIDYTNEGLNNLSRAMDASLRSDAAEPIFDKAIERFKEVIASGYLNWAQVYVYRGHKALEMAALDGKEEVSADLAKQVLEQFDLAEAKIKEAMAIKPNWFDSLLQLGSLEFDRAKLAAQLLVKPPPTMPEGLQEGTPEAEAATKSYNDATQANTREALAKLKADNVAKAESHIKTMEGLYKQAHDSAVAYEQERKADQEAKQQKQQSSETSASGKDTPAAAEGQQMTISQHARILYGNQLYEWSQMLAAVGKDWKPVLDEATSCFREAGCKEEDIRGALKNHTQVDQLDLGPDPEPEQPATPAEPEKPQHKPAKEAKGLPSLDRKPKADKAAA